MKTAGLILGLLFSINALAAPKHLKFEGTMVFLGDGQQIPTTIDLQLKKEKTDKSKYKGKIYYVVGNKTKSQSMTFEIDREDRETEGYVSLGFEYLIFESDLFSLEPGTTVNLTIKTYRQGWEECTGFPPHRYCYPTPDRQVDNGIFMGRISEAQ